jgi:lysophospholipase
MRLHHQLTHSLTFDHEDHLLNDMQFAEIKANTVLAVRHMQIIKDEDHISAAEICDVLLIVTGGTLCMVQSENGYVPCFGLADRLKKYDKFYDGEKATELGLPSDTLITPVTPYKKRIRFKVIEFEKLIDSSNITVEDQMRIAQVIFDNYKSFDGFVVLHGTDTMAYTSSLLSFVLENLNKTVVLTGSQIPLSELRNDAIDNLLGALLVAGPFLIPEVVLYFNNKLYRGNRASKTNCSALAAFNSNNFEPLGSFGVTFDVHWDLVLKYQSGNLKLSKSLEQNISYLVVSPCLNLKTIRLCLNNSKAVIISGYGLGNLPTANQELMDTLKHAVERGVIVCIKT